MEQKFTQDHLEVYSFLANKETASLEELELEFHEKLPSYAVLLEDLLNVKTITTNKHEYYHALSPQTVLSSLNHDSQQQLINLKNTIAENEQFVAPLEIAYRKANDEFMLNHPHIETLKDQQAVIDLILQLATETKHSIRVMTKEPGFGVDNVEQIKEHWAKILGQGLEMRRVIAATDKEKYRDYALKARDHGAEFRIIPIVPVQMIILDGRHMIFSHADFPHTHSALYIRHHEMIKTIAQGFEYIWQTAKPFPEPQKDMTDDELIFRRDFFDLMLRGLSDKAIKNQLKLTDRTFNRRIEKYSNELKAMNRAQLALLAVHHKWVEIPKPLLRND